MLYSQEYIGYSLENFAPIIAGFGVKRLGLFGSFVRNEQTEKSDIDFWIEFVPQQKTYRNLLDLGDFLEKIFERKVELVTPESLSPTLKREILKEMRYVFEV